MNLTSFLQENKIDNEKSFGLFVNQRRNELGISISEFEKLTKIPCFFLEEIESGERSAPLNYLPIYQQILEIPDNEADMLLDLAYCTIKNHPDINDYVLNSPKLREFLRLANEQNLPDETLQQLILLMQKNKLNQTLTAEEEPCL